MASEEQRHQTEAVSLSSSPETAASTTVPASTLPLVASEVPNLLRQYEENLTNAIASPRNQTRTTRWSRSSSRNLTTTSPRNGTAIVAAPSSPRNTGSASGSTALTYHPSPRAVHHSPLAFEYNPPSLPTFSPKRRASTQAASRSSMKQARGFSSDENEVDDELATLASEITLDLEEEEKSEEPIKSPRLTKKRSQKSNKSLVGEEGDEGEGCLICMDEFVARRKAYPLPCTGKCTGAFVHYRCIMAWLGQSGSCPLCRGPCDPLVLQPLKTLELDDMKKASLHPVPLDAGIIRCYVKQIYRGMFKQYTYELYLQGQVGSQDEDKFLLAARRQVRSNMTANYMICTDRECTDENRIGRMGSNFLGTCFTMYDNGRDPQKLAKIQDAVPSSEDAHNVLQIREELGCITYDPNRTSIGPRKMRVCVPTVDEDGVPSKVVRPMNRQDRLVNLLQSGDSKDIMRFSNREPVFREDLGAYCLDFGGRVSMASVKNFQLINSEDPSMGNILQFGRVADDMFTMDFQWPLSPFQAFAISLSSCDTKLACV